MNEKELQALLAEIKSLKDAIQKNAMLSLAFDHILLQLETLEIKLKYQKVDAKDGGLILNQRRKKRLDALCKASEDFLNHITNLHNYSPLNNRWLPSEKIQSSNLSNTISGLGSAKIFKNVELAMTQYLNQLRGGATMQELCKGLAQAAARALAVIQHQKLAKTKNFAQVRQMGIVAINEYVFDSKGDGSDMQAPNLGPIEQAISHLYSQSYNMTLEEFEADLELWAKQSKGALNKLTTHPFAHAKMKIESFTTDLLKQCQALVGKHKIFGPIAQALGALAKSAGANEPNMTGFVEKLMQGLDNFNTAVKVDFSLVQTVEVQGLINAGLSSFIDLTGLVVQHVNQNDAHFVVSQPNFHNMLRQKLNDWLGDLSNAMGRASSAVLVLDSCVVDGKALVNALTAKTKLDHIKQKFQTLLALDKVKIHDQKDSKRFEAEFVQPWRNCIASISVETDFLTFYEKDEAMLSELYLNLPSLLPSGYDAIEALNLAIGDKVDLSREEINIFKKQVNARFAKVEQNVQILQVEVKDLKDVTTIQQVAIGASSAVNEIQMLINAINLAHSERVTAIQLYCQSYARAENMVNKSLDDFNKAKKDIEAFRDMIIGIVATVAATALVATGVGAIGLAMGTAASTVGATITKVTIEQAVKDVVTDALKEASKELTKEVSKELISSGIKKAVETDTQGELAKVLAGFEKYLQMQIQAAGTVHALLKELGNIYAQLVHFGQISEKLNSLPAFEGKGDIAKSYIDCFNKVLAEIRNWAKAQAKLINTYNQETQQLKKAANMEDVMEYNMYVHVFKDKNPEVWKPLSNAPNFKARLLAFGMIKQGQFEDGWFSNSDSKKDLETLLSHKAKPLP